MSTKHRKVKRKFLLSMEELKTIDNMLSSNDVESRLLGLSLLKTSALGKHYFNKGKISGYQSLRFVIKKLEDYLYRDSISFFDYDSWIPEWFFYLRQWIKPKTY